MKIPPIPPNCPNFTGDKGNVVFEFVDERIIMTRSFIPERSVIAAVAIVAWEDARKECAHVYGSICMECTVCELSIKAWREWRDEK